MDVVCGASGSPVTRVISASTASWASCGLSGATVVSDGVAYRVSSMSSNPIDGQVLRDAQPGVAGGADRAGGQQVGEAEDGVRRLRQREQRAHRGMPSERV